MKADNTNTINMVENYLRSLNVIDESVLSVLKEIPRDLFVPDSYKDFAYVDIAVPISENQLMLSPSVEGKILQALDVKSHEDIISVGSGIGFISYCLAELGNKVDCFERDSNLSYISSQDCKKINKKNNINIINENIIDNWSILLSYDIIVLTSSLENLDKVIKNMAENSRAFVFHGSDNAPTKSGIIINKTSGSSYTQEFLLNTDVKPLNK